MEKDYLLKAVQSRVPLTQLEKILDTSPGFIIRRLKREYPREKDALKFDREETRRAREAVKSPYKKYHTLLI